MGDADLESSESPLRELDWLFAAATDAAEADPPPIVAVNLSETDREAIDRCLRLVGTARLDHTLTRSGEVIIPVEMATERLRSIQSG
jgi:hypothetical protein